MRFIFLFWSYVCVVYSTGMIGKKDVLFSRLLKYKKIKNISHLISVYVNLDWGEY